MHQTITQSFKSSIAFQTYTSFYLKTLIIIEMFTVIILDKREICMCQYQLRQANKELFTTGAFKISIPTTLKQASSFGKFKSSLKTHLLIT